MKKTKKAIILVIIVFILLNSLEILLDKLPDLNNKLLTIVILQTLCIFLPALIYNRFFTDRKKTFPSAKKKGAGKGIFTILTSISLSTILVFINYGLPLLIDKTKAVDTASKTGGYDFSVFFFISLLPAVFEEYMFRRVLLNEFKYEMPMNTGVLLSSFCFAITHGSLANFLSPFLAGIVFAYIYILTGAIGYSILAHIISNCYLSFFSSLITYSVYSGGTALLFLLNGVIFFMCLYLTLSRAQNVLTIDVFTKNLIRFKENNESEMPLLRLIIKSPFIVLILLYVIRIIIKK